MVALLLPCPPMLVHLFMLTNLSIALLLLLFLLLLFLLLLLLLHSVLDPADWNFHLPIPMVMVIPFLVSS